MWKYILKRFLILIPTVLVVMLISFIISRSAPGDLVRSEMISTETLKIDRKRVEYEYRLTSERMGLDRPMFYFTVASLAYPDTMHRILHMPDRHALAELVSQCGNWEAVSDYYHAVRRLEEAAFVLDVPEEAKPDLDNLTLAATALRSTADPHDAHIQLGVIDSTMRLFPAALAPIATLASDVQRLYTQMDAEATRWKLYVPTFHFYGLNNQFHHWAGRALQLDFGRSYRDRREVSNKILDALPWTIFMGLFSYIIAFSIAVPLGVYAVRKRGTWQDQTLSTSLFMLHSVPTFVMAMLLMTFLCNPDYLQLFPTSGVSSDQSSSWPLPRRLLDYAYHLILPTLVYAYHSITLLSRQMRSSMLEAVGTDYVRTARAKGLPERRVIWHHAFRNSLVPVTISIGNLLPRLVSGSVITETIFSVPGLGRMAVQASLTNDLPVIVAVFAIGGVLTVVGILIGDVLLALTDPRISFVRT